MHNHPNWFHCVVLVGFLMLCSIGTGLASSASFMVDLLMGEPIPMETLLEDVAHVRVVYVGEIHTIARHHELQTAILRGLAERNPKLALGMEMFTQEQQPILDRWQNGSEDFSALMRDLGAGTMDEPERLPVCASRRARASCPDRGTECFGQTCPQSSYGRPGRTHTGRNGERSR